MIEYTYLPSAPWLIGIGLGAGLFIFASYFWARGRSRPSLRAALGMVRWLIIAALVYCLLDPEWVKAVRQSSKGRFAVLLDTSRSMGTKDLPQGRLGAARAWVQREFQPSVPANVTVSYYGFDDALARVGSLQAAQADGRATGLAGALDTLLNAPHPDPLLGVLVCSDGIENMGKDPEEAARAFHRKGIPIDTLAVGTSREPQDIVVENVQVRRAVPNEAPTRLLVSLRASGYANQTLPVQVYYGDQLVCSQPVLLTGGAQKVEIEFTPRQKGFQTYEVRVPVQPGEWLASNNERLFGLEVIDPTIRVLYMEGTPQQPNSPIPEWKYLKSALESDPHMKVTTLYREFGAKGHRLNVVDTDPDTGERIYAVEDPVHGFPRTLAGLLKYDVVIHSDIRKESFSAAQLESIEQLVERYGGGFVMIGGNSAFGKGGYHRTVLDRIIPVAMHQQNDSIAEPFHLTVPANAWSHPVIALGTNRAQTQRIWTEKFPFLYGCNQVDRAKPGAVVLGVDPDARGRNGPRLILAVQSIGKGRSMAFTSDTTRTWGRDFETLWGEPINPSLPLTEANCDSRYYRQFWVNAVRWLAAARVGRTNDAVSLELAQSYCAPDEKVHAAVTVRNSEAREISTAKVTFFAAVNGETNFLGTAVYDPVQRAYSADLAVPRSGRFTILARAAHGSTPIGEDRQLLVCGETDREMQDLRARPEVMARVAQLSGGEAFSLGAKETGVLSTLLRRTPPEAVEYQRSPVWDEPWWLAGVLGLLTVEWAVRRRSGLA